MDSIGSIRSGGIAGIVFVVLMVGFGFMSPPPPMIDDPASKYLDYLADNRTILMIQASLTALLGIPLILFLLSFRDKVRAEEGDKPILGTATALALALGWAGVAPIGMLYGGLAYLADTDLDASLARNLFLLVYAGYAGSLTLWAGAALFSGLAFIRAAGGTRWLGWLGLVAALVVVIATFSWADSGLFVPGQGLFVAYLALMVYLLAVSIAMVRTKT